MADCSMSTSHIDLKITRYGNAKTVIKKCSNFLVDSG